MQMSFLGSVGHLMAGSGLQQVLEVVYAENAVKHILSGKAIARAIRGHFMIHAALNTKLIANAYNIPLPTNPDQEASTTEETEDIEYIDVKNNVAETLDVTQRSLQRAGEMFHDVMTELPAATSIDLSSEDTLRLVMEKLNAEKDTMKHHRTAQLWLQYVDMIDILCAFIKAERTGEWELHLKAVHKMLPYFAAAGHNLYAKSAYIYLQKMLELPEKHPDIHRSFLAGFHVVRRSDRYWAGLSTDLIIEQVLMRSIKISGGLTRGRGFTETQRLIWLLSMPDCADVNDCMQELTGVNCDTSEQHKDCTKSRIKRDAEDTFKVLNNLNDLNPFGHDCSLRGLVSGLSAHDSVNVDDAKLVGQHILDSMVGKSVNNISFQRKKQAVTLASKAAVTVDNEQVQVDPQLLFQRLSLLATNCAKDDPASYFEYELCTHPAALFDNTSLPWQADKPALADALWKLVDNENEVLPDSVHYVLDGGALLQRLPWSKGETFDAVFKRYVNYVTNKYGMATVVFDGYNNGPDTKDATHLRRSRGSGPSVTLTPQTVLSLKKTEFLSNKANKHRFLCILSSYLEKAGCSTIQSKGDADVLIVQTAVQSSKSVTTVLVGDDTDLLVLLLHHVDTNANALYFRPEPKQKSKKKRLWNNQSSRKKLGPAICSRLLFVHAILGCDTTSRLYGIGKPVALTKIQQATELPKIADIFMEENANRDDIVKAGEKALILLYNGDLKDGLGVLRYKRFSDKVLKSSKYVEAHDLPPTAASAKFHSLRVYYQIQEWRDDAEELDPKDWGWEMVNDRLLP